MPKVKTILTCRDVNCPKCGFPETVVVRDAKTMEPLAIKCSSHSGCTWEKKIKKANNA